MSKLFLSNRHTNLAFGAFLCIVYDCYTYPLSHRSDQQTMVEVRCKAAEGACIALLRILTISIFAQMGRWGFRSPVQADGYFPPFTVSASCLSCLACSSLSFARTSFSACC